MCTLLLALGSTGFASPEFVPDEPSTLPVKPHELPFARGLWHGEHDATRQHDGRGFLDEVQVRLTWKYLGKRSGRNRQCVIINESGREGYYCLYSPITWKD